MNYPVTNTVLRICWRTLPVMFMIGVAIVHSHGLGSGLPAIQPNLGDPAPELMDLRWLKGQPVTLAANRGTSVTVIEFWATWCPPCRKSIPHLTNLQRQFGSQGLVVIGISDEDTSTVESFLAEWGDQMDYAVATCLSPATKRAYMGRYRVNTIPHAFVVDQRGRIVWIGNPLNGLEEALKQLFAGTYDLNAAKRTYTAARSIEVFRAILSTTHPETEQMRAAEELAYEIRGSLTTSDTASQRALILLAASILSSRRASPSLRNLATEIVEQLKALNPSDPQLQQLMRFTARPDRPSPLNHSLGTSQPFPQVRTTKPSAFALPQFKATTPTVVHRAPATGALHLRADER